MQGMKKTTGFSHLPSLKVTYCSTWKLMLLEDDHFGARHPLRGALLVSESGQGHYWAVLLAHCGYWKGQKPSILPRKRPICSKCKDVLTYGRAIFIRLSKKYCWWKKSCTSWYVVYPIIYRVLHIPGGCLGFLNHFTPFRHDIPTICFDWPRLQASSQPTRMMRNGPWSENLKPKMAKVKDIAMACHETHVFTS